MHALEIMIARAALKVLVRKELKWERVRSNENCPYHIINRNESLINKNAHTAASVAMEVMRDIARASCGAPVPINSKTFIELWTVTFESAYDSDAFLLSRPVLAENEAEFRELVSAVTQTAVSIEI